MQISWCHWIWTIDQSTTTIWYVFHPISDFQNFHDFHKIHDFYQILIISFSERNYLLECAVQVLDKDASCENYDFDNLEEEEIFENTVGRIKTNYFGKPRNTNDMFKDGNPNYEYQCFANINSFVLLRPYPQQQREPIRPVFILIKKNSFHSHITRISTPEIRCSS